MLCVFNASSNIILYILCFISVPSVTPGRILGHEGVGVVESIGSGVTMFNKGDRVLVSCISACGICDRCRKGMYSHCRTGGWVLGHMIDGTQAEYVRVPHANTSLYKIPAALDEDAAVMLSDILPTALECGVLKGKVQPGDTIAIVGAGPIGLAAILTAQLYSPAEIIMVDIDDNRLRVAKTLGATSLVNSKDGTAVDEIMKLTGGEGVDVAIEAVGVEDTFDVCQHILAVGGRLANVGVHGTHCQLCMDKLWDRNVTLTTRLVDTAATPMLLKLVESGKLEPQQLVTHTFPLNDIMHAYEIFGNAAKEKALKVVLKADK
jgi:alcohol dehydrogenase